MNILQKILAFLFPSKTYSDGVSIMNISHPTPPFPLSAMIENSDYRNVMIHDVVDVGLTSNMKEYETDMSMIPVINQLDKGTCVEQAEGTIVEFYEKAQGFQGLLSRRDLASQVKKVDGMPDYEGTFPKFATNILTTRGIADTTQVSDDNTLPWNQYIFVFDSGLIEANAANHKLKNYVQVQPTSESIKAALANYKVVCATISVDWSAGWLNGLNITAPKSVAGTHRIVLKGFSTADDLIIKFRNTWGKEWGTNGESSFKLGDYAGYLFDIRAYTSIPDPILAKAKSMSYIFTQVLRYGSRGTEVFQLQLKLGLKADGTFGSDTQAAVEAFQKAHGLIQDGVVGKFTQNALNGSNGSISAPTKPTVAMFCEAIKDREGWYPGSRSFRNNNQGNLEFNHQPFAVLETVKPGMTARFAKFDTAQHGSDALTNLVTEACQGKMHEYNPNGNFNDFFARFAPAGDGSNQPLLYAQFVAQKCGCSVDTIIKTLL